MALLKCPSCGNDVSSMAKSCPKCGHPINSNKESSGGNNGMGFWGVVGAIIVALIIISIG